jgi:hypothetical protein
MTMDTSIKMPLSQRINFRMILFVGLIVFLLGTPFYIYMDSVLSGGIKDRGSYLEVDLKAMSNFPFDQVNGTINDVPKQWRALDGKRVMVEGEMWSPSSAAPELSQFQVVYSIAKCCFNGPAQIQHFVNAKVKNGRIPYRYGLVRFVGTLHVNVERGRDGKIISVYSLDVDQAEPI